MKQVIEQIKKLSGVKTVEPAGENMAVVVFEPELPKWFLDMIDEVLNEPQYLKPEELVKGEIYADEDDYTYFFRFKKIKKNGKLKVYMWCNDETIGDTDCTYPYAKIRHATPEEKRLLLKFEETL